jgi:peroxiredoxin
MKKWCVVFILSLLAISNSFGQKDQQFTFKIDGTINADTGTVHLFFFTDYIPNKAKELVSKIENNKFTFSGYIPEPQSVFILYDDRYMSSKFIIQKGLQNITINVDSSRKVPDVENKIMISENPKYTAFFKQIVTKWDSYYQKGDSLRAVYKNNIPQEIKTDQKNEYNALCILDNSTLLQYVKKQPNSEIAFWRTIDLMSWGYEPIFDSIYNSFSDGLKNGYAGRVLNKKLQEGKQLSIGKQFPSMQCINSNNEKLSTAIFNNRKLTLVDFWYSRCGPCRAQFSSLKNLYNQFSTKGFEIVGISTDKATDKKLWKETIANDKLSWQQYWDIDGKDTHRLSIYTFPTNFLIDNTGKIIAKNISLSELEEVLSKSLK